MQCIQNAAQLCVLYSPSYISNMSRYVVLVASTHTVLLLLDCFVESVFHQVGVLGESQQRGVVNRHKRCGHDQDVGTFGREQVRMFAKGMHPCSHDHHKVHTWCKLGTTFATHACLFTCSNVWHNPLNT